MTSPAGIWRRSLRCIAIGVSIGLIGLAGLPRQLGAQGLFKGVEQGAREGNKAAGPVGGVLGGAIGGVVGVVTGVTGAFTGNSGQQSTQPEAPPAEGRKAKPSKATKTSKVAKATPMLTQPGVPQLTAEQIVANSDSNIERLKTGLNLTEEQAKNWGPFADAMHALGRNGADRLELRIARSKRDPPDDIVEQMRNEAQFLVDRAADQRAVADTSEPLFTSLDDKQKQIFIDEMVRLSRERGLD
ncbi:MULTISPECIES: Spy/CpxP family protein refolding chaperone [unclassified Bradyrhizobium]|uniref:Spy/CpxP family protein refolding chaperone n=1 Tax=unclassified Bradyrhizobium TaxID=2631580 RepID=UPI0029166104|nr:MULTISPECIES: Spy/CpxP family protein refolding chaperone [unclassified Bradyrhizobium]